jgi:cytidylate kinase
MHEQRPSASEQGVFRGAVITIDGPAGSGKSTTARLLAARLGFAYLDTGAMYRAAALLGDRLGTKLSDETSVNALLGKLQIRFAPPIPPDDRPRVLLGDEDFTDAIRTPRIDRLVSAVAAHPAIRAHMVIRQRELAAKGSVVLEGRDTGTVVCADADVKIYLDADIDERAKRRITQRAESATDETRRREEDELTRRDRADQERAHGPLRRADDAVVVNTSDLTIDEQVDAAYRICVERLRARRS